ncbi:MAG: DUF1549 domain-containing protein, partial [Planctomycetes bacterium]|nr:DUF1549 domain-containing protein [Planctomycetota bacterium]
MTGYRRKSLTHNRDNTLSVLIALFVLIASVDAADPVDYVRDIKPIFKSRCVACHGVLKQESGLRLDAGTLIHQGGDGGAVISTTSVQESSLLVRVASSDLLTRMPPEGEPLKPDQIDRLQEWISEGAKYPEADRPESDPREHWAFQPPVRLAIPSVESTVSTNPIDSFLSHQSLKQGLQPIGPAERSHLLRRISFDLIGLPPTRDEFHEFLDDSSPDAYEKVVDRLLMDPRHGERWGRRWMDVWRYSDWYGRRSVPDVMNSYPMIWRWRDWIVRSLNENKSYDRMIVEMLAADELCPDDQENVVATGFIVRNWFKWNYDQWMRDQVEHTGKAFLGMWFQCALCHDHKYDPISQKEYFQLRAFFEPLELRHDRVRDEVDPGPFVKYIYGKAYGPISSGLIRVFDEKLSAETRLYSKGDQRNIVKDLPALAPAVPRFLEQGPPSIQPIELPLSAWYPNLTEDTQREELAKREAAVEVAESAFRDVADQATFLVEARLKSERAHLAAYKARLTAELAKHVTHSTSVDELARQAALTERQANYEAVRVNLLAAEQSLEVARSMPVGDMKQD